MSSAGQRLWQVLPLHPTGYGDSPYAPFSAFAGNPLLISLEALAQSGELDARQLRSPPSFPLERVDYGAVQRWKLPLVRAAAERFLAQASGERRAAFEGFRREAAPWIEDFALFMDIKRHFDPLAAPEAPGGSIWHTAWPEPLALRRPGALEAWRTERAAEIDLLAVEQFFFREQWNALRTYAAALGVAIIGDMPIFVAPDSADVWARRRLFRLDERGRPTVVAGVPPDYFSPTGQLWGNPLYDWDAMRADGYAFWIERIRVALRMVDYLRIDHFRGFCACWEVPAGSQTAEHGCWREAPGEEIFAALHSALGDLPILAEDLGVITPDVDALREHHGFPGMRIMQFAFDERESGGIDADNRFLPHNHVPNTVVYTGTHDNDTTLGWLRGRSRGELELLRQYLGGMRGGRRRLLWGLIRMALASVARFAVLPLQDVLSLESAARMNTPSTTGGNWTFRLQESALTPAVAAKLRALTRLYGR